MGIGHGATYSQTNPKNLQIRYIYIYIYVCVYIYIYIDSLYLEKQSPAISITGYLLWFFWGVTHLDPSLPPGSWEMQVPLEAPPRAIQTPEEIHSRESKKNMKTWKIHGKSGMKMKYQLVI